MLARIRWPLVGKVPRKRIVVCLFASIYILHTVCHFGFCYLAESWSKILVEWEARMLPDTSRKLRSGYAKLDMNWVLRIRQAGHRLSFNVFDWSWILCWICCIVKFMFKFSYRIGQLWTHSMIHVHCSIAGIPETPEKIGVEVDKERAGVVAFTWRWVEFYISLK